MTYVVLKGYLYNKPIDCKARGSNGTEESIQKIQFFSMIVRIFLLVLVSDPGSVSPFFRDDVGTGPTFFVSVDRGEKGFRGKIVP